MDRVQGTIHSEIGFYIGDLWFCLDKDLYHRFWGDACHYEDGVFQVPDSDLRFAVAATYGGDGGYTGSDGVMYIVDCGVLSLVPLELLPEEYQEDADIVGRIIRVPGDAEFEAEGGVFRYTLPDKSRIVIHTFEQRWEDVP
jgi:hypothetical protein